MTHHNELLTCIDETWHIVTSAATRVDNEVSDAFPVASSLRVTTEVAQLFVFLCHIVCICQTKNTKVENENYESVCNTCILMWSRESGTDRACATPADCVVLRRWP